MSANGDFSVFIGGDLVDLVVLDDGKAANSAWYSWFNDEETTRDMQQHYFPNTREKQVSYFREKFHEGDGMNLQLGILHKVESEFIGVISLTNLNWINRSGELGGVIGVPEFRNLKYWLEANRLLLAHAHNSLNIRRVYGGSLSEPLAQMYVRLLGFRREGLLREHVYKNGAYRDCHLFGRILENVDEV